MTDHSLPATKSISRPCSAGLVFCILAILCTGAAHAQTPVPQLPVVGDQASVPINAPIPPITIDAGDEKVSGVGPTFRTNGDFTISGGATVVGGSEFVLRADTISGNMKRGIATAEGHVEFRELNTYLYADSLFASNEAGGGSASNIAVHAMPFTVTAERLTFLKDKVELLNATLTTTPPNYTPVYTIRAKSITYLPAKFKLIVRNGAFYFGKTRIVEDQKLTLHVGPKYTGEATNYFGDSIGYTGYNGPFLIYSTHEGLPGNRVTGSITLPEKHGIGILVAAITPLIIPHSATASETPKTFMGLIRQAAEATEPPLPEGDPLLLHWFETTTTMGDRFLTIPGSLSLDATGTASYRERVFGHETDNLFYSRLPEASLTAIAPISGPRALPTSRDPSQVRAALRQIALYAVVTPTIGRYYEYPDDVTANRVSGLVEIEARPILVGNNLLFKPLVSYQDSTYPGAGRSFRVFQYNIGLERYFTQKDGIGFNFIQSAESGSSPFQFDTPFTSEEFDTRVQWSVRQLILGAALKYNIHENNFYQQQIMIAPVMRGFVPKLTFDFADDSLGVGIDIQGLTY